MFCKNCGKEIKDGCTVCEFCGRDLSKKDEVNNKKLKFSRKTIITIGALLIVSIILFMIFRHNTPRVKELKADFIAEILKNEDYSINEFDIITETNEKKSTYNAIVNVTYDNTDIEYRRQYEFIYSKYGNNWVLNKIKNYKKSDWKKRPLTAPDIADFENQCLQYCLGDMGDGFQYDIFEPVESKTKENLDSETVIFVFNVKKENKIQTVSGEIEFTVVFDEYSEEWQIENFSYLDTYKIDTKLLNSYSWSGSGELNTVKKPIEEFNFKIENWENGKAEAKLIFQGKEYILTGDVKYPEQAGVSISINLVNEEEKLRFYGKIDMDGVFKGGLNTRYEEGVSRVSYYGDIYDIMLTLD